MPTRVVLNEQLQIDGSTLLKVDFSPFERVRVLIGCHRDSAPVSIRLVHSNDSYQELRADLDSFEVATQSTISRVYEIPGTQTLIEVGSSAPAAIFVCIYGFAPN
jgi:hypothetical protein